MLSIFSKKFNFDFKMKIRRKFALTLFSTSLLSLFVLCTIMVYGLLSTREMAVQYGEEIGAQSDTNSSKLLIEQKKRELSTIAKDKAHEINGRLIDMERNVRVVATTMQKISRHPEDFKLRQVEEPPESITPNTYSVFYMQYGKDTLLEDIMDDISLYSNIEDTMVGLVENDSIIDSIFVSSHKNWTLSVDNYSTTDPSKYKVRDIHYDATNTDWYQMAKARGKISFTPVRRFVYSKKLGIFCAMPYYDAFHQLEGVACMQATINEMNRIINEVNIHHDGFCFVIDERGYVILSSRSKKGMGDGSEGDNNDSELKINLATDLRNSANQDLSVTASRMISGLSSVTKLTIDGESYYLGYSPIEETGWSFAVAIPEREVMTLVEENNRNIHELTVHNINILDSGIESLTKITIVFIFCLLGIVLFVSKYFSDRLVRPIQLLSDGVKEISSGKMDTSIGIHTGDEIESLSNSFNEMTEKLKENMDGLKKANKEREEQNAMLRKKNIELSDALHKVEQMRISRDNYRRESEIDSLTSLYNKATTERICQRKCRELPEGKQIALFIIDLDHFKEANDTNGHQHGDMVLSEFALHLKLAYREEDCIGRFGGDEFIVMMEGYLTEDLVSEKAKRINKMATELYIGGYRAEISASIGIAMMPLHGNDYSSLFEVADHALYHVKENGKNGYFLGNPETEPKEKS